MWCVCSIIYWCWQSEVPTENSYRRETYQVISVLHLLLVLTVWSATRELTQEINLTCGFVLHYLLMLAIWSSTKESEHVVCAASFTSSGSVWACCLCCIICLNLPSEVPQMYSYMRETIQMWCVCCIFYWWWQSEAPQQNSYSWETCQVWCFACIFCLLVLIVWIATWEFIHERNLICVIFVRHFFTSDDKLKSHKKTHTGEKQS